MATKKINFDIESREDEEDRTTISINGIGEVVLTETFPEYEFLEDVGEDGLEELNVEEGDLIGKIEHLEINDEYKGQGYAKLLMNKAIELAKEKGLMPLYLNASPMGSKRYGLDVDDLTGFYESLGFEVFLRQGGNNLMILKDTYKTGGETKNKIMAKQMKVQYAKNYSKGGVTFSEWSKDDFFQEQFNEWMEDGNVIKFEDGYSTQDAQYRNRLKNMSDLKRYFYKEFIKGQYNSYAGGGKAVKKYVVTGNVVDGEEIFKETFDNLDEAIELATEIQNGWSDDGTLYLITIYDEKGKKISTISDDKYFNELTEHKFFKKVELGAETKKERQVENEKLKGYKFNLQVRIASYPDNLTIFDKTFDSIFDVMDEMNNYYEEDYYAYINNEDLEYWEDKYYEIDEKRNYIKGKYGWSFFKEGDLWIAKDDFEDKHIVRFVDGKPKSNSSITKGALKQIIELENSNKYADGGSTDDKHLIAKAIEYITGYAVDTDSIVKKGFTYNFTYKGRNVSSSLDSKLIDDTIRMNKKSMASRYAESSATKYAKGGGVKVDGLTKQEFIDAFDKRVENIIENLKQKGEYDSEDFDLYGEADKQGGLTEIEQVGSWYELADEDYNDAGALINYMLVYDFSDESNYTLNTLAHLYFGKPMKLKVFVDSIGDAEYDLYNELQKIKLLSNKIDFNKVVGVIDYEKTNDNTDLDFYKDVELVMTLKGDWNQGTDELDTTIDVNGETAELNYHPLDGMGGINFTQLEENINKAFSELNTYSAVVSIEGYEEYAEDVEGLENARATIQNIKGNTRFQVLKGSSVGIGKRVDDSRVVEEFKKGGEAGFDDAGTSLAMYHETKGNWLVPKGQVYLWLYDVENSAEKIESGEFDYVQYPLTSMSMAWQRGYIPPLKRIWTKKFQKMNKGSEHLLGVIKAFLINENGKEELYIDMMSVNPTKKKKGIMSYMIKDLRDTFNLSQDQITFSKLTPEGEKFVAKKTYEDGGGVEDYINIDKMNPDKYEVVRNFNTLKSLAKMGFIELDEKTGLRYKNYEDKMRGNRVTNVRHDYIKSAISPYFEHNNKQYAIGYIKGLNFLELYVLEDITN
jgi:GNAT superfamily N-acetyltransferase